MTFKFWGNNQKKSPQRMISASRLTARRNTIIYWGKQVDIHNKAIAKIDAELSKLSGSFTTARKELLSANRLRHLGMLNVALSNLEKEKSLMGLNVKHNQKLAIGRYTKP